ncbi:uncharacterized protein si:dkey-192g7.3 [Danio aesculapii]|uniref:uncharacterized protein si:dkey-192g7.3 n=1 Tax=Danio aesculapii TaxID=1142201 RepID=UPI0024C0CA51|nr:uncharacterized protein si:dkey-192g7.3 [Danio aesculapii]
MMRRRVLNENLHECVIHSFHFPESDRLREELLQEDSYIRQRTSKMILILLTLLPFTSGSAIEEMTGYIQEDILLPCNCSGDLKDLVWQRELRVVNVYPEDKSNIDPSYLGRTELFLKNQKKNCSLLLLNISVEDTGVYTCYRIISVDTGVSTMSQFQVNLTVSEKPFGLGHQIKPADESSTAVSISVPILVMAALLAAVLLVLLFRRRHRRNNDTYVPAPDQMLEEA